MESNILVSCPRLGLRRQCRRLLSQMWLRVGSFESNYHYHWMQHVQIVLHRYRSCWKQFDSKFDTAMVEHFERSSRNIGKSGIECNVDTCVASETALVMQACLDQNCCTKCWCPDDTQRTRLAPYGLENRTLVW